MKKSIMFKRVFVLFFLVTFSCEDYLDIVPDRTQEISLLFNRRETAFNALANCYSYLPQKDDIYGSFVIASDELTTPIQKEPNSTKLMKGEQSVSNPKMSFWSGFSGGQYQGSLWEAIRSCNILMDNIDLVIDMEQVEKNEWKAEAQFLKAYYHFLLLTYYGPIPIVDVNIPISADDNEVRIERQPVDQVISYITQTIDESVLNLPFRVTGSNDLGRVDQVIAKAKVQSLAI
jgi:hypothetical protein